jgi:hypothetical protein
MVILLTGKLLNQSCQSSKLVFGHRLLSIQYGLTMSQLMADNSLM